MQDKKNWKEEKICVSKNVWLQKKIVIKKICRGRIYIIYERKYIL